MKTARDVIDRIQWDDQLPGNNFLVGYMDRFRGVVERPFSSFDWTLDICDVESSKTPSAVPQHRIQYFKYKDVKVWEKESRLDVIFGSTGDAKLITNIIQTQGFVESICGGRVVTNGSFMTGSGNRICKRGSVNSVESNHGTRCADRIPCDGTAPHGQHGNAVSQMGAAPSARQVAIEQLSDSCVLQQQKSNESSENNNNHLYDSIELLNTTAAPVSSFSPSQNNPQQQQHNREQQEWRVCSPTHNNTQLPRETLSTNTTEQEEGVESGESDSMYSKVDRLSRRPHSKSQPCSPMPPLTMSGNSTPTNNGRRNINRSCTYKHEKSRSELVPCSIPVFHSSTSASSHTPPIVPPPHTQERLIYERMDSSCSRGSSGSVRSSTATQISGESTVAASQGIHNNDKTGTVTNTDKNNLDRKVTNSADQAERHIYDEVAVEDARSKELTSSERGKDLLAGQKVTAVIPKQALKSLSRSLDADVVTGNDDIESTPTLQVKKNKQSKLRKQKSFTRKWLSNKSNMVVHNSSPSNTEALSYFGQPLENLMLYDGSSGQCTTAPLFVTQCIQYIEQMGLESEGIYRQPGNQSDREKLLMKFDKCILFCFNKTTTTTTNIDNSGSEKSTSPSSPPLTNNQFTHGGQETGIGDIVSQLGLPVDSVASGLKFFFSKLPQPLIPYKYQQTLFRSISTSTGQPGGGVAQLSPLLSSLPPPNFITLKYLITHLNKVSAMWEENKMTSENLATCFWPTLLRPTYTSLDAMSGSYKCRHLVEVLINNCATLFPPSTYSSPSSSSSSYSYSPLSPYAPRQQLQTSYNSSERTTSSGASRDSTPNSP